MVTIRYESAFDSFFTNPFEIGVRHLKVAFCNGSQANLTHLAKEKVIYRALEANNDVFQNLTLKQRVFHALVGFGETVGYLTLVVPFIIAAVDKYFNKPTSQITQIAEGGQQATQGTGFVVVAIDNGTERLNPFESVEDPFYYNASWNTPAVRKAFYLKNPHRVFKFGSNNRKALTPCDP
jgi:hypothetical protein